MAKGFKKRVEKLEFSVSIVAFVSRRVHMMSALAGTARCCVVRRGNKEVGITV